MTSGIYMIKNKISGHIYVGQSIDIEVRWKQHLFGLKSRGHHCKPLQEEYDSLGIDSFEFSIARELPPDPENLRKHEATLIDELSLSNVLYNLLTGRYKSTKTMSRTTIQLAPTDKKTLQGLALRLGYVQTWGKEEGRGSISALMQAIARGEILLSAKE